MHSCVPSLGSILVGGFDHISGDTADCTYKQYSDNRVSPISDNTATTTNMATATYTQFESTVSTTRVAVVTGSNKGIGLAIVRALCKQFDGDVYLTARDVNRGENAVKKLNQEGLSPKFHQLDIVDDSSVELLRDFLKDVYGGLDVLVNNAGITFKEDAPFSDKAEVILRTNFWGTLKICDNFFPILKPHARVVNVSSHNSQDAVKKCSPELRQRFNDPNLTMEGLKSLMKEFVGLTKENKHEAAGWPSRPYSVSKIGVTVMSFIQQKELDAQEREDIIVNACCPGYVATDMTSNKGDKTTDEGAETPVMLALIPPNADSPRGKFLSDKVVQNWG